ncbi:MAG: ferritin, partial [Pseudomonadota bacterium]
MISEDMQQALQQQLNDEFYSGYIYLAMSAYCASIDFNGAANWLKQQYEEERQHATRIYNYLVDQGAQVELKTIPAPPSKFGSLLE